MFRFCSCLLSINLRVKQPTLEGGVLLRGSRVIQARPANLGGDPLALRSVS